MPIRTVPGFDLEYCLVCLDGTGAERLNDPDGINGRMIPRVTEVLAKEPYTDVFLMSHGWMGGACKSSGDRTLPDLRFCQNAGSSRGRSHGSAATAVWRATRTLCHHRRCVRPPRHDPQLAVPATPDQRRVNVSRAACKRFRLLAMRLLLRPFDNRVRCLIVSLDLGRLVMKRSSHRTRRARCGDCELSGSAFHVAEWDIGYSAASTSLGRWFLAEL